MKYIDLLKKTIFNFIINNKNKISKKIIFCTCILYIYTVICVLYNDFFYIYFFYFFIISFFKFNIIIYLIINDLLK